ncbi:MAG: hypothetical protein IKV53_01105 [Clostridia bacterium]|nr:hypothetical protein [Clostridia bacterium]
MKKAITLTLLICLLVSLFVLFTTGSANKTDTYILYKNDAKFDFAEYPAVVLENELYVPSSFFLGFENVLYEYSEKYQSFYFWNKPTGEYFAYSLTSKGAVINGEYTQKEFPIIHSTIYLPLEFCADILSLRLEYYNEKNVCHVRLYDTNASLDFLQLIELFDPIGRRDPIEPDPPIEPENPVEPELPEEHEKPVVTDTKSVYLMLMLTDDYAKEAIDLLYAFGERATLYFDRDLLLKAPREVYHAEVNGNAVGITASSYDELSDTNMLFCHISNYYTRLCYSPDESADANGYAMVNPEIVAGDYTDMHSWDTAEAIYNEIKGTDKSTVLIEARRENENLLMSLLGLLANDVSITLETLS